MSGYAPYPPETGTGPFGRSTAGKRVLQALCELEIELSEHPELRTPVFSGEIARKVGRKDGRAVARPLARLENAGLAARVSPTSNMWRATQKGRRVDELLASVTHERGGTFQPWASVPELRDVTIRLALR